MYCFFKLIELNTVTDSLILISFGSLFQLCINRYSRFQNCNVSGVYKRFPRQKRRKNSVLVSETSTMYPSAARAEQTRVLSSVVPARL